MKNVLEHFKNLWVFEGILENILSSVLKPVILFGLGIKNLVWVYTATAKVKISRILQILILHNWKFVFRDVLPAVNHLKQTLRDKFWSEKKNFT